MRSYTFTKGKHLLALLLIVCLQSSFIFGQPENCTVNNPTVNLQCGDELPLPDINELTCVPNFPPTINITDEDPIGGCGSSVIITRNYEIVPTNGDPPYTVTQDFIYPDNTIPPMLACQDTIIVPCPDSIEHHLEDVLLNYCGIEYTLQVGTPTIEGGLTCNETTYTYTYTVTDQCGLSNTCDRTFKIQTQGPIFPNCPLPPLFLDCYNNNQSMIDAWLNSVEAFNACGLNATVTNDYDEFVFTPICGEAKLYNVMFTATDECGMSNTCMGTIEIQDITPPTFDVPSDVTIDCDIDPNDLLLTGAPLNEMDDCDLTLNQSTFTDVVNYDDPCIGASIITRTWSLNDDCGNVNTGIQIITVEDVIPPTFNTPDDITISCEDDPSDITYTGTPYNVADNCDPNLGDAVFSDITYGELCGTTPQVIERTWSLIDACGNESTGIQIIAIEDTTPPSYTTPSDLTIDCSENPLDLMVTGDLENVTDNCDPNLQINFSDVVFQDTFCVGTTVIERYWNVSDICGNTTTSVQLITLDDITPPTFEIPLDLTIQCDQNPDDLSLTGMPTNATDNCDPALGQPVYSDTFTQGSCSGNQIFTRTWSLSDACGNVTTGVQIITSVDNISPNISPTASDMVVDCGPGMEQAFNDWLSNNGGMYATDNCSAVAFYTSPAQPILESPCNPGGGTSTTVGFIAEDECFNISTSYATFTINYTPLSIDVPAQDLSLDCSTAIQSDLDTWLANNGGMQVSGGCGNVTITNDAANASLPDTCGAFPVVFTVTDDCGYISTSVASYSMSDNTPPTITITHPMLDGMIDGDQRTFPCDQMPFISETDAIAEDNCWLSSLTFEAYPIGDNNFNYVWTAIDECGVGSIMSIYVYGEDLVNPVFTSVPDDSYIICGSGETIPMAEATDNCSPNVAISFVDQLAAGEEEFECNYGNGYTLTRTHTATDDVGNSASVQTYHTFLSPSYTGPNFTYVPENLEIPCYEQPVFSDPTVESDCGNVTLTFEDSFIPGDGCAFGDIHTRLWTAIDECSNSQTASQYIIMLPDTDAPEFTFIPQEEFIPCNETPVFGTPQYVDNCSSLTPNNLTFVDAPLDSLCGVQRTWTITDDCGNYVEATQKINFIDTEAPQFNAQPTDLTINCVDQMVFDEVVAFDQCGNVVVETTDETLDFTCAGSVMKRTWIAADDCGNLSTVSQTITVEDNTIPVFTTVPETLNLSCYQDLFNINDTPEVLDDCSTAVDLIHVDEPLGGTCTNGYSYMRTWIATDMCGNVAEVQQPILILPDVEAPIFSFVPENMTITCADSIVFGTPQFIDQCENPGIPVDMTYVDTPITDPTTGLCGMERTWTIADNCGNVSTASQMVTKEDFDAPEFNMQPTDLTLECGIPMVFDDVQAFDQCGNAVVEIEDVTSGNNCSGGITQRIWTATDECGNVSSISQTITMEDSTIPVFTYTPQPLTLSCYDELYNIYDTPQVLDDCSSTVDLVHTDVYEGGDCTNGHTYMRLWIATDDCGNVAEVQQPITIVQDYLPPLFTYIPENMSITCADSLVFGTPQFMDECGDPSLPVDMTYIDTPFTDPTTNLCGMERIWTIIDNCGNTSTASQMVIKEDYEAPLFINTPVDRTISCEELMIFDTVEAYDSCGTVELTFADEIINQNCGGFTQKRTWTATDDCGNVGNMYQIIHMEDNVSPIFTSTFETVQLTCNDLNNVEMPTATDNCSGVTIDYYDTLIDDNCQNGQLIERVWMAIDQCGNMIEELQTISVAPDANAPVFDYTPQDLYINCGETMLFDEMQAFDECGNVDITHVDEDIAGTCQIGSMKRTWFATDACGNMSTVTQSIYVEDYEAPILVYMNDSIASVECYEQVNFETPVFEDFCGEFSMDFVDEMVGSDCANGHTMIRTWIATDYCGNATEAVQTVNILPDTDAPIFTYVPQDQIVSCGNTTGFDEPQWEDRCSPPGVAIDMNYEEIVFTGNCGMQRIWTITDHCGNTNSASQIITFDDAVAPQFLNQPFDRTISCGEEMIFDELQAYDDCGDVELSYVDEIMGETCGGYTQQRIWTAIDPCGNVSTMVQTISLVDDSAPIFTNTIENLVLDCTALDSIIAPVVIDECSEVASLDYYDQIVQDDCNVGRVMLRVWVATDMCGNVAEVSQGVTLLPDEIAPVFNNIPFDQTINCEDQMIFDEISSTSIYDQCGEVELTYVDEEVTGTSNCTGGIMKRTWTAIDPCGNASAISQTITVVDNQAPIFVTVPQALNVTCYDELYSTTEYPEIIDNCSQFTLDFSDEPLGGSCENGESIRRLWLAIDNCGNVSEAEQILTVLPDTEAPIFLTVPEDKFVPCGTTEPFDTPEWMDPCGNPGVPVEMTFEDIQFTSNCGLQRIWTIYDQCGNTSTTSQTITYDDTIAPQFSTQPVDKTISCGEEMIFDDIQAFDECSEVELSFVDEILDDNCGGVMQQRTWTAIDVCGNMNTMSQIVNMLDDVAPVFTSPIENLFLDCNEFVQLEEPIAEDNCDNDVSITFTETIASDDCQNGRVMLRIWVATDNCGNAVEATQAVTLVPDTEAPIFTTVPSDRVISCDEEMVFDDVRAEDICGTAEITFVDEMEEDNCGGLSQTRIWTAMDDCGNARTISQTINMIDDVAPTIFMVDDSISFVDCNSQIFFETPEVFDNCSEVTLDFIEFSDGGTHCDNGESVTRIWIATDACGNASEIEQVIYKQPDTQAPIFTYVPESMTMTCGGMMEFGTPEWEDDCSSLTPNNLTFVDTNVDDNCSMMRTWTIVDNCGNVATASQTIIIEDNIAPQFSIQPIDKTIGCGEEIVFDDVEAFDECNEIEMLIEDDIIDQNCSGYSQTRTWIAIDNCGNESSVSQTIEYVDLLAPIFVFIPESQDLDCTQLPEFGQPVIEEDCGEAELTYVDEVAEGSCESGFIFTRIWTATDNCGNSSQASQTFTTGLDVSAPEFEIIPTDKVITCGDPVEFDEPNAYDVCSGIEVIINDETFIGDCNGSYHVRRTWTAIDDCGNESTVSQTITTMDFAAPEFTIELQDIEIACGEEAEFEVIEAVDNCSQVTLTFTDEIAEGSCTSLRTNTRTWIAVDACGNESVMVQRIIFLPDNEAPVFDSAAPIVDKTITCGEDFNFDTPVAFDSCGEVELNYEDEDMNDGCKSIRRTWFASDNCGNLSTMTQIITAIDDIAPDFVFVPESQTLDCSSNPDFGQPEIIDNCGNFSLDYEDEILQGECSVGYSFTRTWFATDDCGNVSTASQNFNSSPDTTPPFFETVLENKVISCSDELEFDEPEAYDVCGAVTLTYDDVTIQNSTGTCAVGYTVRRTWTATDNCGNANTITQSIEYTDNEAPVFENVLFDQVFTCGEQFEFETPVAFDNCGNVALDFVDVEIPGQCASSYVVQRTWTATDDCGNVNEISQVVSFEDSEAPVFTTQLISQIVSCGDNITMEFDTPEAFDNCGEVFMDFEDEDIEGTCESNYSVKRTWYAFDDCGNMSSIYQIITTVDDKAPEFANIPESKTIACGEILSFDEVEVFDNCSSVEVTFDDEIIDGDCESTYVRTWIATDDCGNASTATQIITTIDQEAPVFIDTPAELEMTSAEFQDWILPTPIIEDACNAATVSSPVMQEEGDCNSYVYTYTWSASDNCNNVSFHTMSVYIIDVSPVVELEMPTDGLPCGNTSTLNIDVIGGVGPVEVFWSLDSTATNDWAILDSNVESADIQVGQGSAVLIVSVVNSIGCSEAFYYDLVCQETNAIENITFDTNSFQLFPNPTSADLNIRFNANGKGDVEIALIDLLGRTMQKEVIEYSQGDNHHLWNVNDLAPGAYFIRMRVGTEIYQQKFIKQ